jgi:hypothetical protein
VFASLGREGLSLIFCLESARAEFTPGAGFRLGGAWPGFPDFSRFPAYFWGILALFRVSGRADAPVAKTPKP